MSSLAPLPAAGSAAYRELVERRSVPDEVAAAVAQILTEVRSRGDHALAELTERYDGVRLTTTQVPERAMQQALASLDSALVDALREMAHRIELVHGAQQHLEDPVSVASGVRVWREWRPFDRVGLYAPGGRTVYPSSVLMLAIPARLAGCREIVLCSPPQSDAKVAPAILAAAAIAGVTEVHAVGGAQAIGALAYGTHTIRPVQMIAGPGNAFVTAAKLQVYGAVAIDMPAGPSEVVVISDGSTDPDWLAGDLRAQAEHSPDALAILVTTSQADAVALDAVDVRQVRGFLVESVEQAIAFSNDFAPEHLALSVRNARKYLSLVTAVGSVFLGGGAPPAAGDYATGANHVLPTGGSARSFGALGVRNFGRPIQVQEVDTVGIEQLVRIADVLARHENLPGHAASVRIRSRG